MIDRTGLCSSLKPRRWGSFRELLISVAETIAAPQLRSAHQLTETLREYLEGMQVMGAEAKFLALSTGAPIRLEDGSVCFSFRGFWSWCLNHRAHDIGRTDVTALMEMIGFRQRQMNAREGDKQVTRRVVQTTPKFMENGTPLGGWTR